MKRKLVVDFDKIYTTTNYGNYKIIKDLGYKNNDSRLWVRIKFLYTGFEKDVRYDLLGNDIIDPYYPRIFGIACIGEDIGSRGEYKKEYDRWYNLISRCYNPNDKDYKKYGALGVKVDSRWLIFSNYYNDIKYLPGYHFLQEFPNEFTLDKDYLQKDVLPCNKLYSKNTCIFVDRGTNSKISNTDFGELDYVDRCGNIKLINMVNIV